LTRQTLSKLKPVEKGFPAHFGPDKLTDTVL